MPHPLIRSPIVPDPIAPAEVIPEAAVVPATEPIAAAPTPEAVPAPAVRGKVENDFGDDIDRELAAADAIINGTAPAKEPQPVIEAPAAEVAPVIETEAAPEIEPTAAPVVEDDAVRAIERPRLKDPTDQLVAGMKLKHPDWSWAQCETAVSGPEVEAPVEQVDSLAEELAEIKSKLILDAKSGNLNSEQIEELRWRASEIMAEQKTQERVAPLLAKEAEREEQEFTTARAASRANVEKNAPAMYQEGTPLIEEAREVWVNMQDPQHPSYIPGIQDKRNAPEIVMATATISLAEKIAARDNIPFDQALLLAKGKPLSAPQPVKTAAAPPTTPPVTAARKPAVTAPGSVSTRQPDRAPTAAELEKALKDETDPEKIDEILRGSYAATHGGNGRVLQRA